MDLSYYYILSIPAFLGFMVAEYGFALRRGFQPYRLLDTVSNLNCGLGNLLFAIVQAALMLAAYRFGLEFALFDLQDDSVWTWVIAFLLIDFTYYWFHRMRHETHLLWMFHSVHHQSEDYNLGVALRLSWVSDDVFSMLFYWPLPVVGVGEVPFFVASAVATLFQASLHTRLRAGKPTRFGLLFNTPSYHRVHHARGSQYNGCNHGGMLIVWDRLFGTFREENEALEYGLSTPLRRWNPVPAQLQAVRRTVSEMRNDTGVLHRLLVLFRKPVAPQAEAAVAEPYRAYDYAPPRAQRAYILLQMVLLAIGAITLLTIQLLLPWIVVATCAAYLFGWMASIGALSDGAAKALLFERLRLAWGAGFGIVLATTYDMRMGAVLVAMTGVSAVVFEVLRARRVVLQEARAS